MKYAYRLSDQTFTFMDDDHQPHVTDRSNPNWEAIKAAINRDDTTAEELIALTSPITAIATAIEGVPQINIRQGAVFYGEEQIHNALTARLLDVMNEGINLDPWVKFTENVYANPFTAVREELYPFLENWDLSLTEDGCFLAYKVVRDNYLDCFSGTLDHSPGKTVVMPGGREAVDADRRVLCSTGLHFCSKGYLPSAYGLTAAQRVMIMKVNPADVVAIPEESNAQKGRTWRYEVIGEIDKESIEGYKWGAVHYSDDEEYEDDDYWDEGYDDSDDYDWDEDDEPVEQPSFLQSKPSNGVVWYRNLNRGS